MLHKSLSLIWIAPGKSRYEIERIGFLAAGRTAEGAAEYVVKFAVTPPDNVVLVWMHSSFGFVRQLICERFGRVSNQNA